MIKPSSKCTKFISVDFLKTHCTSISKTKQAHALLLRTHLLHNPLFSSKLISFLALSHPGDLNYARKLFTQMQNPDPFICNTMIRGYARSQNPYEAVSLYYFMVERGVPVDNYTYPFVLAACARLGAVKLGRRFHCEVLKNGFGSDLFVINALIQFYHNCGSFGCACEVFDESTERDVVTWNIMINAHLNKGLSEKAFDLLDEMTKLDNLRPDEVTMVSLVPVCAQLGNLERGKLLHSYSKELGLDES